MFDDIHETYSQVKTWFESPDLRTESGSSLPWARMQELNDYAYYILTFSQFEAFINDEFLDKRDQDFEIQRLHPGKIDFMEKVDVVFDGNGKIWSLVEAYYDLRCQIAHGNLAEWLFAELSSKHGRETTIDTLHRDISDLIQYPFRDRF